MNTLTKETIEKIEELIHAGDTTQTLHIDGESYVKLHRGEELKRVSSKNYLGVLHSTNLSSLITFTKDILKNYPTDLVRKFVLQVQNYQTAILYEPVDDKNYRNEIFSASESDTVKHFLNTYITPEEMIINLRRTAEPNEDFEKIIKIISGVSNKTEVQTTDDGLGQTTTLMQGNTKIAGVEIKSIATLQFKRTFTDLSYIEENFVLRLKDGKVALFTAGSEEYRRYYIDSIRFLLQCELDQEITEGKLLVI